RPLRNAPATVWTGDGGVRIRGASRTRRIAATRPGEVGLARRPLTWRRWLGRSVRHSLPLAKTTTGTCTARRWVRVWRVSRVASAMMLSRWKERPDLGRLTLGSPVRVISAVTVSPLAARLVTGPEETAWRRSEIEPLVAAVQISPATAMLRCAGLRVSVQAAGEPAAESRPTRAAA